MPERPDFLREGIILCAGVSGLPVEVGRRKNAREGFSCATVSSLPVEVGLRVSLASQPF